MALLTVLVEVTQAANSLEATLTPIASAFINTFAADGCILQLLEGNTLIATQGSYGEGGTVENWLAQDPLVSEAIATGQLQVSLNVSKDQKLASVDHYQKSGVQAHLVIPITFRSKVMGVLSLQWKQAHTLREDELKLIHLSAQLVAIALTSSYCHQTAV